jgi:methenyltetrahydrofolate cyclohydrolase
VVDPDYLDLTLADFLDRTAAATPAPGAGTAAAMTVAIAAGLTAMSAGLSRRRLPDADELVGRALDLQERVKPLGRRDAAVYGEVLQARGRPSDDPRRQDAVGEALSRAADVPLEIAEAGVEVLQLAADAARRGSPSLRGDAVTACLLARAGVRAAALLVELNLPDDQDERRARAAHLVEQAAEVPLPLVDTAGEQ